MTRSFTYDVNDFCELYPHTPNKVLAEKYSVSLPTIVRTASRHGLTKDPSYMVEQQRKRATGRVLSEESKAKIGSKAKGRVISEETKRKIIATKIERGTLGKGETHYNWKGGKPWERFKDPEYRQWREQVLSRDGYVCQDCNRQCKKSEKGLAAHHLKPYAKYPELRLDVGNGVTLCRKCHMARHGKTVPEEKILCGCGCGTLIDAFDKYAKRPRQYVNGHYRRGRVGYVQEVIFCACGCGETKNRFDKNGREGFYIKSHAGRAERKNKEKRWTCECMTQQSFIELYPITKTTELAKICQVSSKTVNQWAKKLGLQKIASRKA